MTTERLQEILEWIKELNINKISPEFVRVFPFALLAFIFVVGLVFISGWKRPR